METLPKDLQARLTDAHTLVDRIGRVPIWYRQALYGALGRPRPPRPLMPEIDFEPPSSPRRKSLEREQRERDGIPPFRFDPVPAAERTLGHLRRTALAIQTVDYVLARFDVPEQYRPAPKQYNDIHALMAMARRIYAGEVVEKQGTRRLFLATGDAHTDGDAIQLAAAQSYYVAMHDGELQVYPLPPVRSDKDLYVFRHDAAGLAALALAGQVTTFWRWWVGEAIPAAWFAHPE